MEVSGGKASGWSQAEEGEAFKDSDFWTVRSRFQHAIYGMPLHEKDDLLVVLEEAVDSVYHDQRKGHVMSRIRDEDGGEIKLTTRELDELAACMKMAMGDPEFEDDAPAIDLRDHQPHQQSADTLT